MNDLIADLPKPSGKAPVPGHHGQTDFDAFALGFGALLLFGTQALSKSAPQIAKKVSENILGPEIALGAPSKFHYTFPKAAILFGPAPFGFVDPTNYGLEPNYLAGWNKFVTFNVPSLGFLKLPESEILKTLPDYDPRVMEARWKAAARLQQINFEQRTSTATLEQLLDLYALAKGPNAGQYFFDPAAIANALEVSIRLRAGEQQGNKLLGDVLVDVQSAPSLPRPGTQPDAIPSPLDPVDPPSSKPNRLKTLDEIIQNFDPSRKLGLPLESPPANNLQREAAERAPDVLKHIVSERADP